MADKRIIEQNASTTVPDDAFFIFDSALLGTFKISQSALLDFFGNATITEVTKAQYDALPDTKLTDGVLYAIKDQETSYVVDIEVNGSSVLDEDGIADLSVISKIEEEIANAIAEEYDSTHTYYNTGLVFHEGVLYQCTATSVTGTWDSTKWNVVDIKDLLDNVSINIGYLWNTISNTIAGNYDTSSTYNTGDYVIYSLKLYRCKDDGVTGAWNSSKWEEVNIPEYIDYVLENAGKVDDVKVDGTSVVTNKVAEIEIPVKDVEVDGTSVVNASGVAEITLPDVPVQDVQVKTDSTYDSVVDASGNAKIDLSSVTAYGEVPNLPQAIATFNDGADAPMKSLKVAIEPQQDLHGYDAPWVGGAGKNKFDVSDIFENKSLGGSDGQEQNSSYRNTSNYILVNANSNYVLSLVIGTPAQAGIIYICFYDANKEFISSTYYSAQSGTITKSFTTPNNAVYVRFPYDKNSSNIQLESGSTATSFAPYSNICPISGWDKADVTVADDVETPTVSNVYTIDLDGTRYGGKVDVVSGVMTVDRAEVDLGTLAWNKGNINIAGTGRIFYVTLTASSPMKQPSDNGLCEALKYNPFSNWPAGQWERQILNGITVTGSSALVACVPDNYSSATDFKTAMNGVQLVYELATPLTIQLTPTAVKSLLGSNNVWADTGDINDCIYRRDMSSTIDDIIARLEALENA